MWPRFLEVFNEEYFFETVRDQKTMDFLSLMQRNMIVAEYNTKFMELSQYTPHIVSSEARKARKFAIELRQNIHNKVDILQLRTHQEVVQRAVIAERTIDETSQY